MWIVGALVEGRRELQERSCKRSHSTGAPFCCRLHRKWQGRPSRVQHDTSVTSQHDASPSGEHDEIEAVAIGWVDAKADVRASHCRERIWPSGQEPHARCTRQAAVS